MKNQRLLITWDMKEVICEIAKYENIQIKGAYQGKSIPIFKYFRELWFALHLPFKSLFFNRTLKDLEGTLIVFDSMIRIEFMQWLKEKNPRAKVIFWYWNNEKDYRLYPDELKDIACELWSFNKKDCEKYGLRYNTQFYGSYFFETVENEIEKISIKYDLVFVGRNKGRNIQIEEMLGAATGKKINIYKYYVNDNVYKLPKEGIHKPLSYMEFLKVEMQGKAILDWVVEETSGLSLRVMEALYFHKKLVTNNRNILEYDFYHSDNIFVVGHDALEKLPDFLEKPYSKIKKEIRQSYQFNDWISRFNNGE